MISLPQSIIFNCTGMGSRELFHDHSLIPVTGQLIELKPQLGINFVLAGPVNGNLDNYLIPVGNRLILGGSYEYDVSGNEVNMDLCKEILKNAKQFYQ